MRAPLVLVVDDDTSIVELVVAVLQDEGYATATARNGLEALAVAEAAQPAAILLDMRMPVCDGWEFARRYRAEPGPRAPLLVMTAAQHARQWCEEVRADACLPKPFDMDDLLDCVKTHTHRRVA